MTNTLEIVNAKITSTFLGEEQGVLTSEIHLVGDMWGQSFGGYYLSGEAMSVWVKGVLDALEITDWNQLNGTVCRIKRDNTKIYEIGNIIEDKWFNPKEAFEKVQK